MEGGTEEEEEVFLDREELSERESTVGVWMIGLHKINNIPAEI